MQPINVAVVDVNQQQREAVEHFLQHGRQGLAVLTDALSKQDERVIERRLKSRENITLIEDNLARINRLKPQVLFVNAQYFLADCMFFVLLRRQCPEVLANGVCGFLSHKSDLVDYLKATKAVKHCET